MNVVFDNPSVEYANGKPVRIHWFCTHEAMQRENPPGTHSDHLHPDVVNQVPEHVMHVPEHGSSAITDLLNLALDARDEWCSLRFVPYAQWVTRKSELDAQVKALEAQRGNIAVVKRVVAGPKDLFVNVCQHGPDRKNDKSCSVSLKERPDSLPEYAEA